MDEGWLKFYDFNSVQVKFETIYITFRSSLVILTLYHYNPSHREAKIWNNVFDKAEKLAGIERGSIRATVLIETLPAVFQMNEILYELKDHSVGLNCGRWDYIFSYIKTFQAHLDRLVPDRVQVGMSQHFMRSYSDLLIYTCHRRGVHAMGGMVCTISLYNMISLEYILTLIVILLFFLQ